MRRIPFLLIPLALMAAACKKDATSSSSGGVTLRVAYGSEKQIWLDDAIKSFLATSPKTKAGVAITIKATAMGSGETVQGILDGTLKPHVFSPASSAYINLLNQRWLSSAGRTKPISPAGDPIVLSPIVIAMWKPMAEALGWPAKALGWKTILEGAAGPEGWAAHGKPEWGALKLGHTSPELSSSGLLAVLAEAYAGAGKTRGGTAGDRDGKNTQACGDSIDKTSVDDGESYELFV